MNTETEMKFREHFNGTLPKEFSILPNPESVFQDEKIREEL